LAFKQQDPDLLLRKFKDKLSKIAEYKIKVGIPKEFKEYDFADPERGKKKAEADRVSMARSILGFKPKESKGEEDVYIADIAFKNNFGSFSEGRPARPFGSTVIERYKIKIKKTINKEMSAYLKGKQNLETALNRIGLRIEGYMKDNLTNGNWAPNAPLTIFLKGSSQPLIHHGQMRQAITYIIEGKNE